MLCALEIGLLIWGIVTLIKGRLTVSKNKVVTGGRARLIGVIMLLPLPLAFIMGAIIGVTKAANNQSADMTDPVLIGVEAAIVLGLGALAIVLGLILGESQGE